MAQYFYNFSDRPLGAFANGQGMTLILSGSGTKTRSIVQNGNGKVFRIVQGGTSGQDLIAFDALTNHGNDTEALALFSVSAANQVPGSYGAILWDYTGATQGSSVGFLPAGGVRSVMLYDDKAGLSFGHFNYLWTNGQKYWIRYRVEGGVNHYVKIWADGSAEPGSWNMGVNYSNRTTGTHYMGIGTYTANHTIDYFQVGIATGGETAPSNITTDRAQTGAFSVNVLPTSADAGGFSGGYGGIAGYGQAYGHAFTPTATLNDKTQTGVFRVKKTFDHTQTGQFRVKKTFEQNQLGKFRIQTTGNVKYQFGQFRVRKELTQNQVGKFRVQDEFTYNQSGTFRVRKTFSQEQLGAFRVASEPSRVQVGQFRVQVSTTKTQQGRFLTAGPQDYPQDGKFRVEASVDSTQLGKFRIQTTSTTNQIGKFRVESNTVKNQTGLFRVQTISVSSQLGRFSVKITTQEHQVGNFLVEYLGTKHQTGKFRIYGTNTLPEVFINNEKYRPDNEQSGSLTSAQVTTGRLGQSLHNTGTLFATPATQTGSLPSKTVESGRIYSNNEHVILLWEDGSIWIDEYGDNIMVEEYEEGGIMDMIPKNGTFNRGSVEHGNIQEVI